MEEEIVVVMAQVSEINAQEPESQEETKHQQEDADDPSILDSVFDIIYGTEHSVTLSDVKEGARGLLDIMIKQRKFPCGSKVRLLYKFGLFIFYLVNFVYPIVIFAIEGKNLGYNIVCTIISFIGLVSEFSKEVVPYVYHTIKNWRRERSRKWTVENLENIPAPLESGLGVRDVENITPQEEVDVKNNPQNYVQKAKSVFKDFIIDSLGELLIYPSIICSLYGFINERGWEFGSTIAVIDFALLIYSVIMDVIYTKINYVWLVLKIVRSSFKVYDEFESRKMGCPLKCLSPFSLIVPYAIILVISHWLMLAIIGVRIYVDNFAEIAGEGDSEVETGTYKSTHLTRYMIFCGVYLPFASAISYIIINKYWFVTIFKSVKDGQIEVPRFSNGELCHGLCHFLGQPSAYFALVILTLPFVPFVFGIFFFDYNSSDYQLTDDIRTTEFYLGVLFLGFFLISNIQVAAMLIIIALVVGAIAIIVALFVLYVAAHIAHFLQTGTCTCICCDDET